MDDRPLALVTAPFRGAGLDLLHTVADVVLDPWIDHEPIRILRDDEMAARVVEAGASILLCEADMCGAAVCALPLRAIGSARGTPTNVDLDAATAAGIPVLFAPGRNADAVAELTVALTLAVVRRIIPADDDVRSGHVFRDGTLPYQRFRGWHLAGRTVGVIGLGSVGQAAAWRFAGLGMRVISFDPFHPDATHPRLEELLAESDVVSIHAAVTPETRGMIGADQLSAMRPGAVFVNTARAALHDLDAVTEALISGHLGGVALDHFDGEQLPDHHPLLDRGDVVLTPHIGGATFDTEDNHSRLLAQGVVDLLAGRRPAHLANPTVMSDAATDGGRR